MLNQRIDSYIEPLLKRVLETDKFGICFAPIQLESTSSSCDKAEGDRFKLLIPYAKHTVTWDIYFDSQRPKLGPDFIFNDDSFLIDTNIDALCHKVPSLAKWDVNNENALLNVLMELLLCYKQHQIELLQTQERIGMEYNLLMNSMEINVEDMEVILLPFGSKPTEARFLIRLSINVPKLEDETHTRENDTTMLCITFYGPTWNRINPQIFLSKYLEHVINKSYQLPHYPPDKLLSDYVVEVKKKLEEKVRLLVESEHQRKLFLARVLAVQHQSLVEYDSDKYSSMSFLIDKQDFTFLVNISLPPNFPSKRPTVTLTSVYHTTNARQPYKENLENFKYSSDWMLMEMIQEIFNSIDAHIDKFKQKSIRTCS